MGKLTYGPVPSRRFGLSLGVDVVPFKTCTLDCIYCQLGPTDLLTVERQAFVPPEQVVQEVVEAVERGPRPDVITFAGSGEPTLYLHLGTVARELSERVGIPLNLITNGTLLWMDEVARDAACFDMVAPNLDAGDEQTFARVNRPHSSLDLERVIDGIARFAASYRDKVRLEVFLAAGVNDSPEALAAIVAAAGRICPAMVELNTAVRPTPGRTVSGLSAAELSRIAGLFDPPAEPVAVLVPRAAEGKCPAPPDSASDGLAERVVTTLKRRPCTLDQLAESLGAPRRELQAVAADLVARGMIREQARGDAVFLVV